jgi:hypothetical protein
VTGVTTWAAGHGQRPAASLDSSIPDLMLKPCPDMRIRKEGAVGDDRTKVTHVRECMISLSRGGGHADVNSLPPNR